LCSSDEGYAQQAADMALALKQAGARKVAIAGQERDLGRALADAPVDLFVFAGCDVPALLTGIYDDLFTDEKVRR
jgi:methylmalonyl-CoA mutase